MSKAIKFRCWDVEKKCWLHEVDVYKQLANQARYNPEVGEYYALSQFTGLLDKNKKEIYSGDFVRQSGTLYEIQDCIGGFDCQIWKELKNGGAVEGGCYTFSCLLDYACEVVGNIYENPELIRNTTA